MVFVVHYYDDTTREGRKKKKQSKQQWCDKTQRGAAWRRASFTFLPPEQELSPNLKNSGEIKPITMASLSMNDVNFEEDEED